MINSSDIRLKINRLLVKDEDKFLFPPLNSTNIFATIDYDPHLNTKIDYAIIHVFETMTVS